MTVPELTPELQQIDASWANPAFTSPTASADALQKLSLVFPWLSESEVALEFAGFLAYGDHAAAFG